MMEGYGNLLSIIPAFLTCLCEESHSSGSLS